MIYIFINVGEFGYELLNWQGVVRKFSETISQDDKIVIVGRKGLESWYEYSDQYIDISHLSQYSESVADCFWCHFGDFIREGGRVDDMNNEILSYVSSKIKFDVTEDNHKIVMSNQNRTMGGVVLNGLRFGGDSSPHSWGRVSNSIYGQEPYVLPLENNKFVKIEPNEKNIKKIEKVLGFNLKEPYIICQTGWRQSIQRCDIVIPKEKLIEKIAKKVKVVLLGFRSSNKLDSYSEFESMENCYNYNVSSFEEQSCLINNSNDCLFFTEGDFRSHTYVPPFLGKDVYTIASEKVYGLLSGITAINFWNDNIFKFGGKIKPFVYEDVFKDDESLDLMVDKLIGEK
tara:strand:+ start:10276 stop:11304 length:1029 start_codon:yes stop_codon:yes gene_type:complete